MPKPRTAPQPPAAPIASATSRKAFTVPQLSRDKGIPPRSIHDLIARGLLPYFRFPGGRRLWVYAEDFDALVDKCREVRAIA